MTIQENIILSQYTTFKIGGPARYFCSIENEDDLISAIKFAKDKNLSIFILGGGSNVLINDKGFNGLVLFIAIRGISYISNSNNNEVKVSASAGEQWDSLVENSVSKGLYGLENLSAIPGNVGAAPVQNIGAYGAEVCQTIDKVRVFDISEQKFKNFSNQDCKFSYRNSIFKKYKNQFIITKVDFILKKDGKVNLEYKDVKDFFTSKEKTNPSLLEVREAIIDIRWNKLPDWKLWGTAGSFFKNPIVEASKFSELKAKYTDLPGYPEPDGRVKISLAYILDKICNAKGLCFGNVCVYEKQSLVIVAKPGASSEEVIKLAQDLMSKVKHATGIDIEGEVEWVN